MNITEPTRPNKEGYHFGAERIGKNTHKRQYTMISKLDLDPWLFSLLKSTN
jgi:hypothetical protein